MKKNILILIFIIPVILLSLTFEYEKINEFAESGDFVRYHRIIVEDDYLYAISIYGLEINEVNVFSGELTRISLIPFEGQVDGIEKIGEIVFVSVSTRTNRSEEINSSLYAVDVSNPFEPIIVNSTIFPENVNNYTLRRSGEYISYHRIEEIYNVWYFTEIVFMDPVNFAEVATYEIHTFTDHIKDNYFLQQRNPGEYDFDIYDYTDIHNIQLVSTVDFSSCPHPFLWGHAMDDSTFVLLGNNDVSFYDFSDIYNVEYISTHNRYLTNSSPLGDCLRIDDFLLIPSQRTGIEVIDISDLANPVMYDFWEYPQNEISPVSPFFGTEGGLSYNNGHLYVGTSNDGLLLMNFNNGNIEYVDKFINNRNHGRKHKIFNNQLISTGYSGGLYVYNLDNIQSPELCMVIFEDLFVDTFEIVNETIFLCTSSFLRDEYVLRVYNISDLSNPILQLDQVLRGGTICLINDNEPDCLYISSFSFSFGTDIRKYDVSNPEDIEQILHYEFQNLVEGCFFKEEYLYLIEFDNDDIFDLLIYDGFEDEAPELLFDIPNFVGLARMYKTGNYLQLSRHSNPDSDYFYNLTDPLNPELEFTTPVSSKWKGSYIRDNVLLSPGKFTIYLYNLEGNPSGEIEPFDYFNLNSRYKNITFYSQGYEEYFFCEQSECISTYNYSIETSAEEELPKTEISLSNYPNPFNPETNIVFNLPEEGKVQLEIYNIKGQKIKTLLSDQIEAGQHSIVWDGKDQNNQPVSSGIYFYKLQTSVKIINKKMLLLK